MENDNFLKNDFNTNNLPEFSSEKLLQQAIAGLLAKMPNIKEIQILQGAQETGKDIVFKTIGAFGEILPCACVVKNTTITGSVGKQSSARTVLQQVEQALDTPYRDGAGQEVKIQRVYIISSLAISGTVINSIAGALAKDIGRVQIINGYDLYQLFIKYWPNFLADEANSLEKYLNDVSSELSNNQSIRHLANLYDLNDSHDGNHSPYIKMAFSRKLASYNNINNLFTFLLKEEKIGKEWAKRDIEDFKFNLGFIKSVINHIGEWGYLPNDNKISNENILDEINNFGNYLIESFVEAARIKSGVYKMRLDQIPTDAKYYLYNFETVKQKRRELITKLKMTVRLFTAEIELSSNYLEFLNSVKDNWKSYFANERFIQVCKLNDCINSGLTSTMPARTTKKIEFPSSLLDESKSSVLIVGQPGSGKTTFCRRNALLDAQAFRIDNLKQIPIYVPLYQLERSDEINFENILQRASKSSALLGDVSEQIFKQKKFAVRLYLDGLDEISNESRRKLLLEAIHNFVSKDTRYQVIITSRDAVYGQYLSWLPRISLNQLNDKQLEDLINLWLGENSILSISLIRQIKKIPSLKEVIRNPLLATLTILLFRRTERLPENKVRLYLAFTELLSGGWDLAKGILRESKFGRDTKIMVLSALSANLHFSRDKVFARTDLVKACRIIFKEYSTIDIIALEKELLMDGLIERVGAQLQFSHLSFQEYLAAKYFIGSPRRAYIRKALKMFLEGDDWWAEVIKFCIQLSANPAEFEQWIKEEADIIGIYRDDKKINDLTLVVNECLPDPVVS